MKVRQEILEQLTSAKRAQIAVRLNTGQQNIDLAVKRNSRNGRMTKMDFLKAVSEVLNVDISEILEEDVVEQDYR